MCIRDRLYHCAGRLSGSNCEVRPGIVHRMDTVSDTHLDVYKRQVEDLVVELASRLVSNPRYTTSEKTEWVLHSIACRAAIQAGDNTRCV